MDRKSFKSFGVVAVGLFLGLIGSDGHASKYALLVGGSGEDLAKENFFKKDFERFSVGLKARHWQTQMVFDNDPTIETASQTANNNNIDSALEKASQGAKPGDEVLLFFHAHGHEHEPLQDSHNVMTETPGGFNLDKVKQTVAALKAKGVKVAIVDLSCYSGNTQALRAGTCTVTLASAKYVSICSAGSNAESFTEGFTQLPSSGPLNLEDQFLAARRQDASSTNIPEISSIGLPGRDFWNFFLKGTDPESIERDEQFSFGEVAGKPCYLCNNFGQFKKSLDAFNAIIASLEGSEIKRRN